MMIRNVTLLALSTALLGALVGCNHDDAPPPQLAPATAPAGDAGPALAADDLEHSSFDVAAPFVLKLEHQGNVASPGEVVITAKIDAPHTLNAPASIQIALPGGAHLVSGQERETLAELPGGLTTRAFRVALDKGLTGQTPIEISVQVKDAKGAFGAFAKRALPEAVTPTVVKASQAPTPPVGRPGAGGVAPVKGPRRAPTK